MKRRKLERALTLREQAILARSATDVLLPDNTKDREAAIDRLARTPVVKRPPDRRS